VQADRGETQQNIDNIVFGVLLRGVFQSALERRLDRFDLAPAVRAQIEAQQSRLAAAETGDARDRQLSRMHLSRVIARCCG
jgi:hypothetical protein